MLARPAVLLRVLLALPCAPYVASCGGLVAADADAARDDGAGAGAPGGASAVADSGLNEPDAPSVPPAPKAPAPVTLRCSFSDGPFLISGPQAASGVDLFVRIENADLLLYVSNGASLRRYRLQSQTPCVLERDASFDMNGVVLAATGRFAIDDAANVWLSYGPLMKRVVPQPIRRCTMDAGYVDADGFALYAAGPLYLDEGGATGWALGGPPGKLGRFTAGPDACSVALVDSPFAFSLRSDTPRDAAARLHVVDSPAAGSIGIYTGTGAFVASYFTQTSPNDPKAVDVTRCGGGVCVLGSSSAGYSVTYASQDGAPHALLPAINGLEPVRIAAERSGPVFLAGPSNTMLEPLHQVIVQLAPAPP